MKLRQKKDLNPVAGMAIWTTVVWIIAVCAGLFVRQSAAERISSQLGPLSPLADNVILLTISHCIDLFMLATLLFALFYFIRERHD